MSSPSVKRLSRKRSPSLKNESKHDKRKTRSLSPRRRRSRKNSSGFVKQSRKYIRKATSPKRSREVISVMSGYGDKQRLAYIRRRPIEK
jgi:hypothetical protein